jgi:hypothetical protein
MKTDRGRSVALVIVAVLVLAYVLRVVGAVAFPTVSHPDEVFQTREPAHRLAYGYGVLTWEWYEGVRSWVFPAFLAGVMRATEWISSGSSGYLLGIAVVLSLLSLTAVWFGFLWAYRAGGGVAAVISGGACAIWYELVYYAPKALYEVFAAHLLLPGLYLGMYGDAIEERRRMFFAGLLLGLAAALRIPFAPVVVFAAASFSSRNWRVRLPAMAAGISVPVVLFGLVDAATWSYPFQSFIRYVWFNVVQGGNSAFGASPWYWYLQNRVQRLGPLVVLALVGARRSPFLGWAALIILLSHSVVAHKEARFVYPLLPLVVTLAALGLVDVVRAFPVVARSHRSAIAVGAVGLIFFASLSASYGRQFARRERENVGSVMAFEELSHVKATCGVAFQGLRWSRTGGYTYLHQPVPLFAMSNEADVGRLAPAVNSIVATVPVQYGSFKRVKCWNRVCLYQRTGSCQPAPKEEEIGQVLQRVRWRF